MSIDKDFVLTALLQHNYLPTQRRAKEELPPRVSTLSFTPDVAKAIAAGSIRAKGGYDSIDYRMTRFNSVSRSLSIPHPAGHAQLSLCIYENWHNLEYVVPNTVSRIRPHQHPDGRLVIMEGYESSTEKAAANLRLSFGKRFVARTDISNCFPSIYSHAVPWATVGIPFAKKHLPPAHKTLWFNELDLRIRWTKRNETQGIGIGPATSNVVSEAILARIDSALAPSFKYIRFIDDYTAFCDTEDEAQKFLLALANELSQYKLLLNAKKTKVLRLPTPVADEWVSELGLQMPQATPVGSTAAFHFINVALRLSEENPEGSVLKYALKALVSKKLGMMTPFRLSTFALNLAFHQPALLAPMHSLLESTMFGMFLYGSQLHQIALENTRLRRSDGICWSLYYLNKFGENISDSLADAVVRSKDCMAMLLLFDAGNPKHQALVVDFAKSIDAGDVYALDQYWMLLYQLFRAKAISKPYSGEDAFDIMLSMNVNFLSGS